MRVTNEQATAMAKCCGTPCSECSINGDICDAFHREELATDLLDARELIDKQESLIKEMRKVLKHVQYEYDPHFQDIDSNDIDAILEKTNEYV